MPSTADAEWLVGDVGRGAIARAVDDLDRGAGVAAVLDALRGAGLDGRRSGLALEAAEARRRARATWPGSEGLVLTRRSLEQASQPVVAAWRARRYAERTVADLCAGAGADAEALAAVGSLVLAVEHDPGRAVLLRHNLGVLAPRAEVREADALTTELPDGVAVHVDPDRRDGERRLRDPDRYRPSIRALDARFRATIALGVTVGPGVDLDHPSLRGAELEFIQVGSRLTEAVRWTGELRHGAARTSATLLPGGLHLASEATSGPPLAVRPVGSLLLDPAPALVRARLHDRIGATLGPDVGRLAARSALLTADTAPRSPWMTARQVLAVLPARPRAVRAWLATADAGPVELALGGLPVDVEAWWRDLGRPPRGPDGVRVDLVRLDRGARAILSRGDAADRPVDDVP